MPNDQDSTPPPIAQMNKRTFFSIGAVGLFVGAMICGLTYVISRHIVPRLVCNTSSEVLVCTHSELFASNLATVIGALIGVLLLLKLNIFRPLLTVVVTAIALWNIEQWVAGGAWYEPLIGIAVMYCLSYITFAWIVRIQSLKVALPLVLLVIITIRYLYT